jgi:putative membrane protein
MLRRRRGAHIAIIVATTLLVFLALGVHRGTTEDTVAQIDDVALWMFLASGAVAICAMILPGISGSFILVILGMYGPVLGAVNDRDVASVLAVGLGAVIGLALFSQVLQWALTNHHDTVIAGLIGLMAGSLRVVWPWPDGVDSTAIGTPNEAVAVSLALAAVGFLVVLAVHAASTAVDRRTQRPVESR